ncbi:MAG: DNA-binding domain-containing protein [Hyphomicrobiales bacterium]|nr:DNA-binding domain-containing protein [Hyphomicrobiales bacterium]
MPPLSDNQRDFAQSVMDADHPVPAGVTSHLRAQPLKRFNVYRNNVYSSLIDVLQACFPVVTRLVGEEFFRATARVYVDQHPPTSPVLMRYGHVFADFLQGFEPVDDVPYLPDVARLEWAWSEAYNAADRAPVTPEALQSVPPEKIETLLFELHPSARLVRSEYPIVTIWSSNSRDDEPEPIDAGAGSEDALILRPGLDVEVRRLPAGGAVFIDALADGLSLGAAAQRAAGSAEEFDLQANLTGLFGSGAITSAEADGGGTKTTDERGGNP